MIKQTSFKGTSGWGGKRKGAGRKNKSKTVSHTKRPTVNINKPLHITMRLKDGKPNLRKKILVKKFKESARLARRFGFYVIHFSLLGNHIHMIIEANDNRSLEKGMKSLAGRFAKIVSLKSGPIFQGRYHIHILKTPREMKRALLYVLLNHSQHAGLIEYLDPFSSAKFFKEWKILLGPKYNHLIREQLEDLGVVEIDDHLSLPKSWLCQKGWMRAS